MYDIIVIGAGVSGCAAARELSRYQADICVVDKEEDVCCGTSKANSAIVHAGYDAAEGSLMAKLNVEGNYSFLLRCHRLSGSGFLVPEKRFPGSVHARGGSPQPGSSV